MAAVALIQFVQGAHTDSPGKAVLGAAGDFSLVTVTNGSNTDVASWKIYLLDAPPDSATYAPGTVPQILAQATSNTPTVGFTPDAAGSYRVMLEVTDSLGAVDRDIRCFGIPDARGYVRPPYQDNPGPLPVPLPVIISSGPRPVKPDEQNYGANVRGWAGNGSARQVDDFLRTYDDLPSRLVTTTPFTASVTDPPLHIVNLSTIGSAATFNLPATPRPGFVVRVSSIGASPTRPLTISAAGGGLIGSATTLVMLSDSGTTVVHQGSNNWAITASRETFLAPGTGPVRRSVSSRLADQIHVADFMTPAELQNAIDGSQIYDIQPAIQKAVDYAVYSNGRPEVILPPGWLRIDRPIHLGYGTDFRSLIFKGQGQLQGGGGGTVIIAHFDDAPAIVIQGGRNTVVRDMVILQERGGAHILSMFDEDATYPMSDLNPNNWVDPTFPASANSRYAPQCGIAVDPYSGSVPTPKYPDVEYPAEMGAVPQYGKLLSRNVLIEDVWIQGFVVGVVIQPNQDANGDFTKLRRVYFLFCVYGYSWGNSQARVDALYDCVFAYVHTSITSNKHGNQTGHPQIVVYSCSFEIGINIVEMLNLNYGQGPTFIGCYCEAMYRIGVFSAGNAIRQGGVRFTGCEFGFSLWERYGVPTGVLEWLGHSGQAIFDSCFFYLAAAGGGYLGFRAGGVSNEIEAAKCFQFTNCHVDGQDVPLTEGYQRTAYNATTRIVFNFGSTCLDRYSLTTGQITDVDSGSIQPVRLYSEWTRSNRSLVLPVYAQRIKALASGSDPGVHVAWKVQTINATSITSQVGRTLVIVVPTATTANLMHSGGDVGDILVAGNGAAFLVKSRTGTNFTIEAVSGFDNNDNLLEELDAAPTFYTINCRRYSLNIVCYGDVTYGSDVMTNIINGAGPYPDIPTHFTVGDYLYCEHDVDMIIDPLNSRLVSFDNSAKTLTFAGPFQVTQTRRRITLWVRPAMPNVA